MRYRIIQAIALLTLLVYISGCFTSRPRTDRRRPPHYHYHRAGRSW